MSLEIVIDVLPGGTQTLLLSQPFHDQDGTNYVLLMLMANRRSSKIAE